MTLQTANARALWAAAHTGEIDEDPDANGDGAEYAAVPCEEIGDIDDTLAVLPTSQQDGTMHGTTAPEIGPDGWKLTIKTLFRGLATSGGAGVAPGAMAYMTLFLANLLKAAVDEQGRAVGVGSTTTSLVLGASVGGLQSLMAVTEAGVPSSTKRQRAQWSMVTDASGAPTYAIAPTIDQAPTNAAIKRPVKTFIAPSPGDSAGALVAFVHLVGGIYTKLLGGRLSGCKVTGNAGKLIMVEWMFMGDSIVPLNAKPASLPDYTIETVPGVVCTRSPVWFNNVNLGTTNFEIDFAPATEPDESTAAVNGRASIDVLALAPKITLTPTLTNTVKAMKRAGTKGPLLIQLGAGMHDGTRCNGGAIHFAQAHVPDYKPKNEKGWNRATLTLEASRAGLVGGAAARFAQVALI